MGRTNKTSLQYFNVDVNIFHDKRVRKLTRKFERGIEVYIFVLSEIYRDKGYYVEFDEDSYFDISDQLRIDEDVVKDIINFSISVGLFSSDLFGRKQILTSKGIQSRYVEIIKSLKRKVYIAPEYDLISSEETPINSEETLKDSEEKTKNTAETPISSAKSGISSDRQNRQDRIDRKEGNEKNISLSEEISAKERREIFEIFFFEKRCKPQKAYDDFVNHYSAVGWVNGAGHKIQNKVAQARKWKCDANIPEDQVKAMKQIYAVCLELSDPLILLSEFRAFARNGSTAIISVASDVFVNYLESAINTEPSLREVIQTALGCQKITYSLPK